ncbi:MAG: TolC family protein [Desulfopila sp.]
MKKHTAPKGSLRNFIIAGIFLASTLPANGYGADVSFVEANILSLKDAVRTAQRNDPWLVQNRHSQDAVEATSIAAATMPDPRMSVGLANFPTDTFDIKQDPMTQVKIGITQILPRGDSLTIKQRQLQNLARRFPFQRQDRRAKTVVTVGQLWFDAYTAQQSIALIQKDRPLFEQLADVAEASYSSGIGRTRQQDIVRAQLELTRLEDRLTMLKQQQETVQEKLAGWLRGHFSEHYHTASTSTASKLVQPYTLNKNQPRIAPLQQSLYRASVKTEAAELHRYFIEHPAVQAIEKRIDASRLAVDLAREKYKPQFGLSAGYGYRDDGSTAGDRADFISFGLSFDLPVFTKNRQKKEVQAALSQAGAVKTGKWTMLRQMIAEFEKNRAQLNRLTQRQQLYQDRLLPQMHEQTEASLTAYTNDDGDFAEVVRARIAELNARIELLNITVAKQKAIIRLNYYFMQEANEIIARSYKKTPK